MELQIFEVMNEHVANIPRAQAVQASEVLLECQSGLQKDANHAVTKGCRRSLRITLSSAKPCMVRRLAAQFIMTTGRIRIRTLPSHYAIYVFYLAVLRLLRNGEHRDSICSFTPLAL